MAADFAKIARGMAEDARQDLERIAAFKAEALERPPLANRTSERLIDQMIAGQIGRRKRVNEIRRQAAGVMRGLSIDLVRARNRPGVYFFTEGDEVIYAGHSRKDVANRIYSQRTRFRKEGADGDFAMPLEGSDSFEAETLCIFAVQPRINIMQRKLYKREIPKPPPEWGVFGSYLVELAKEQRRFV